MLLILSYSLVVLICMKMIVFVIAIDHDLSAVIEPKRYSLAENISNSNDMYDMIPLPEIERNLTYYLHTLHARLAALAGPHVDSTVVWETFLDVTRNTLMNWDDQNKNRYPRTREDGTIYVALGTYRDPYCPMTIKSLFDKAEHPELLFVGLFQQNCFEKVCRTGVLVGGAVEDAATDVDCYVEFCKSPEGIKSNACNTGQVRLFNTNESESLGPYMARYLGGKFYRGEQYYLQIDSHSEFADNWDTKLKKMYHNAPAKKPVLSTYPPAEGGHWQDTPGSRICTSEFAKATIESQIIRLVASGGLPKVPERAAYAPFVAAGFIFTSGKILHEVPFDPLLPWIFMGEEISMSSRLWTSGYDLFFPNSNVLNHYYVRRHYPKFWESVNRFFKKPIHNDLADIVLKRVKHMLGYPESTADMITPVSLLYRHEEWGMGKERSFDTYMEMVGIHTKTKTITPNTWCDKGVWPDVAKEYYFERPLMK